MGKLFFVFLLCNAGLSSGVDITSNLTGALESFHERLRNLPEDMFEVQLDLGKFTANEEMKQEAENQAKQIRSKLSDLSSDVYNLRFVVDRLSELEEEKEEEKVEEKVEEKEECGSWYLGMNLNPSDGHIMGYETGWSDDSSIGTLEDALIRDYLNQTVWNMPTKYMAIVRHHQGKLDAVKVFTFKHWGLSLSHRFKDTDPGRNVVTEGGAVQEYTVRGAHNLGDDPIFSVGGDLAFNWGYSYNGARLVLTGGHLSGADVDDDNTHGFGNNFAIRPKMVEDPEANPDWAHEISNIQDCPYPSCTQRVGVRIQGTDHGSGPTLKGGPAYGNYAIYISDDSASFPTDGTELEINVKIMCKN